MNLRNFNRITVVAIMSIGLAACGINSVPTKEEAAKSQWGNVESALQRRSDLIPNMVEIAKAGAMSEENILVGLSEARAKTGSINITTDDLSDPEEFAKFQAAQNQLTQAIGQFKSVVEAYPQITSNEGWADLRTTLDESENLINTERVRYNEKAQDFNTEIRTFPSSIGANIIHGSERLEYFEASEEAKTAPKVDLSAITGDDS